MFDSFQLSRFLGKPVRFFRFEEQGVVIGRFCDAPFDLDALGFTWKSATIDHSAIKETIEPAKDKVTIKLAYLRDPYAAESDQPSTQDLGDNWHPYPPSDTVFVQLLAGQIGDTDPPTPYWNGVVVSPDFTDVELTLTCLPGNAVTKAVNQGWKFQVGCPKTVYSTGPRGCHLALDAFAVATVLETVAGLELTSADFAAAPLNLAGGWVEWDRDDGRKIRRTILTHLGAAITIPFAGPGLAGALAVVARPSCEQTWAACDARGNTINYGGAIYKPIADPLKESMSWG